MGSLPRSFLFGRQYDIIPKMANFVRYGII